ncbi:ABC transporter permease [Vagococcus sp.]|uniref:ABC transporter permease n=1 Tax=Vagococcus sp. TaxID=1933889 RepID=UPI003F96BF87
MATIYQKRLARYQKKMMKYMKYILNDHFLIVCMFGIGGFGLYYSEFIKNLQPTHYFWIRPVILGIWLSALFFGNFVSLLSEADEVFLLAKERQMPSYFKKAFRHSLLFPCAMLVLVMGMTVPALLAVHPIKGYEFLFFLVAGFLLKASELLLQLNGLYAQEKREKTLLKFGWFVLAILVFGMVLYLSAIGGMILSLLVFLFFLQKSKRSFEEEPLNWHRALLLEKRRLKNLYRFINLFVDVPDITSEVKRRKYLDPYLQRLPKTHGNTYSYLYQRVFFRGTEYLGLVIRLTLVGAVLIAFTHYFWLKLLFSLLFIYLIAFQLIPLYHSFDYMVMTNLYPIKEKDKEIAVKKLISKMLMVVGTIFMLVAIIAQPNVVENGLLLIALLVFGGILSVYYLPKRIKKIKN